MRNHLIWLLLVFVSALHAAQPIDQEVEWMALLLDGHKTGHLKSVRSVYDDRVEHEEKVHISIKRSGVAIEMTTTERSVETPEGKPLAFYSRQAIGGGEMTIEGTVENGVASVTTISGGNRQTQTFPWPQGAKLPEALRLATEAHGLEPGTSFTTTAFIPSSLQATDVTVTIGGREPVDLFGVEMDLIRTEQTMELGQTTTTAVAWVDRDLRPKKMRFEVMGMALETISCPEECATADIEPAEFFTQAFVAAPRPIDGGMLSAGVRYVIEPAVNAEIHFPQSGEQQVERLEDGGFQVTILPQATRTGSPAHDDNEFLGETRWLQSGAPEIRELAEEARGAATEPAEVMQRLESFVRRYVSDKNLSVGYATALETARSKSGDCTEHALLLAAMGRAVGIPTRVATGVAYVDSWLGSEDVFVPHAWTQARIEGRWVSFDAALGGFDAGHLALSYGDGDPWHFYDAANTLGNFSIRTLEPAR